MLLKRPPIYISPGFATEFICPCCEKGFLISSVADFNAKETEQSKKDRNNPAWDCDWDKQLFSTIFECNNNACSEIVCASGMSKVTEDDSLSPEHIYPQIKTVYLPLFFYPPISLFHIPQSTVPEVRKNLEKAFSSFWNDPDASLNKIRTSIECLMDSFKIRRTHRDPKAKKMKDTNLHQRIEIFSKKYKSRKEIGDNLLALKWISNNGSHRGGFTAEEVWQAFEVMEHTLNELYENKTMHIKKTVKHFNRTKGRLKKRT